MYSNRQGELTLMTCDGGMWVSCGAGKSSSDNCTRLGPGFDSQWSRKICNMQKIWFLVYYGAQSASTSFKILAVNWGRALQFAHLGSWIFFNYIKKNAYSKVWATLVESSSPEKRELLSNFFQSSVLNSETLILNNSWTVQFLRPGLQPSFWGRFRFHSPTRLLTPPNICK